MARKVFFSFHYDRDILRVGQVRNSGVTKSNVESAGFIDSVSWESLKRQGDDAIKRWIKNQLDNTSVTVVLIGAETADRDWVKYEIQESFKRGNGLLGVYIHGVKDLRGNTDYKGSNPFDNFTHQGRTLSQLYRTYDWVLDNGYNNFGRWVEDAATAAGR